MAERNVFLSYAMTDRPLVEKVVRKLQLLGTQVASDEQLRAGEPWGEELKRKIAASEAFVVLVTPTTFDSPWVLQELGAAWALNKPIIVVLSDRRLFDRLPLDLTRARAITLDEVDRLEEVFGSAA